MNAKKAALTSLAARVLHECDSGIRVSPRFRALGLKVEKV